MADTSLARTPGDDDKISKALTIGLPIVTISAAAVVGVMVGAATSILVLAAGLLLGVIALLWGSLRLLTGDAALPPELEVLDMESRGVDALASRKTMLLRALKDLENERAFGKIEDEDYEQISQTYRAELKTVLRRMDEALAPHRARAEDVARKHLERAGLSPPGGSKDERRSKKTVDAPEDENPSPREEDDSSKRVSCPSCGASNEIDAKFCKECATRLSSAAESSSAESAPAGEADRSDGDDTDDE